MGTPLDQFQQDNHGLPMDKQHATPSPPVDVQALAPMVSTSQAMPNEAMPTHPDHGRVVTGATTGLPTGAYLGGDGGKAWSFPGAK